MVVEMRPSRRLIGQFLSSSIIHWHGQQRRQSVGLIGCAAVPLGGVSVTCLPRNARIYHHLTPPTAAATDRRSQPIELPSSRLLVAQRRRRRQINSYCQRCITSPGIPPPPAPDSLVLSDAETRFSLSLSSPGHRQTADSLYSNSHYALEFQKLSSL